MDSFYLSPSKAIKGAEAASTLLSEGKDGWLQVSLNGVGQKPLLNRQPPRQTVSRHGSIVRKRGVEVHRIVSDVAHEAAAETLDGQVH